MNIFGVSQPNQNDNTWIQGGIIIGGEIRETATAGGINAFTSLIFFY